VRGDVPRTRRARAGAGPAPAVKVNVTDTTHRYADCTTSLTKLTSATTGPARILWTENAFAVGDNQWAVAELLGVSASTGGVGTPQRDDYSSSPGAGTNINSTTFATVRSLTTTDGAGTYVAMSNLQAYANIAAGTVYALGRFQSATGGVSIYPTQTAGVVIGGGLTSTVTVQYGWIHAIITTAGNFTLNVQGAVNTAPLATAAEIWGAATTLCKIG
jgi:hypothetical protein